jgi:hypothetical protein
LLATAAKAIREQSPHNPEQPYMQAWYAEDASLYGIDRQNG